jgi:hypothetical protein
MPFDYWVSYASPSKSLYTGTICKENALPCPEITRDDDDHRSYYSYSLSLSAHFWQTCQPYRVAGPPYVGNSVTPGAGASEL